MNSPLSDLILRSIELRRLTWVLHPDLREDSGQLELQATEVASATKVANLHAIKH